MLQGFKILNGPDRLGFAGYFKYPVNKWVKPPPNYGPLTVFISRQDAEAFLIDPKNALIVRCYWKPWRKKLPVNELGRPIALWSESGSKQLFEDLPLGTYLARAIKCIE